MKTIIAIKGHVTRYKEVIEILEMLGGKNEQGHNGNNPKVAYYICDDNIIRCDCVSNIYPNIYKCIDYTLEEFLEKHPYKVGDKVRTIYGKIGIISKLIWSNRDECIRYELEADTDSFYFVNELQPYKEETMEIKRIAIVGHKTRGKEVIEILEMLGGINTYKYSGENEEICFAIGGATKMIYYDWINDCYGDESGLIFTLEEFLEKYPYKVGDKVIVTGLPEYPKIINFMKWFAGNIHYSFDNEIWFLSSALKPYKEETMKEQKAIPPYMDYDVRTEKDMEEKLLNAETYFKIWNKTDNGYEVVVNDNYELKQIDNHFYIKKKQPQYPKTYGECHELMVQWKEYDCNPNSELILCEAPIHDFCKLIVARNVYWKIAGEQMGLGEPWKPNWLDTEQDKLFVQTVLC